MIKWLGENGGELVGTKKYLCVQKRGSLCAKKRIFVYKFDSFEGFIGDEQVHAQECYDPSLEPRWTRGPDSLEPCNLVLAAAGNRGASPRSPQSRGRNIQPA
jgi:hypothetical protein